MKTTRDLGNNSGEPSLRAVWTLAIVGLSLLFAAADVHAQAAAAGPYSFFPLTPCRVVDTRNANGPSGGPVLAANTARSFPIINVNSCGVPARAKAAFFKFRPAGPGDKGTSFIFPADPRRPTRRSVTWWVANLSTGTAAFF